MLCPWPPWAFHSSRCRAGKGASLLPWNLFPGKSDSLVSLAWALLGCSLGELLCQAHHLQHLRAPSAACRGERRTAGGQDTASLRNGEGGVGGGWPAGGHRREGSRQQREDAGALPDLGPTPVLSHADSVALPSRLFPSSPCLDALGP